MGAPAVGILLAANSRAGYIRSLVPGVFFVPLGRLARTLPRIVAPGPAARALVIAAVVAILLVASLVALVGRATETTSRSLALAAVLFALAGAFLPLHIPGWQYFSTRFVPLAVLLAIAVVPLERLASPSGVRWSSIAIFVCSAAWLVTSYPFHRRLADTATAALRGLEAPVTRHEVWLPFILDPFNGLAMDPTASEVPYLAPLLHIGALYATVHGGIIPFTFASSPATCPFQVRPLGLPARPLPDPTLVWNVIDSDPFHKDPVFRHGFEDDLANYAMYYEGVLLVGAEPSDIAHWKARGFLSEWQGDSVFLGHFEPCAVDVVTTPSSAPTASPISGSTGRRAATFGFARTGTRSDPTGRLRRRSARTRKSPARSGSSSTRTGTRCDASAAPRRSRSPEAGLTPATQGSDREREKGFARSCTEALPKYQGRQKP
jgi:hypothetical protein